MLTRTHVHKIELRAAPERVFAILHKPSAIRAWWGAARAIVLAHEGGTWMAAWGENEDEPDYMTVATIRTFEPPHRLVLTDYKYHAKSGPLPFQADFTTEFTVEQKPGGALLRVSQDGFPCDPVADEFYAGCAIGWRDTFESIKRYLTG